jgi:hypothetical protein
MNDRLDIEHQARIAELLEFRRSFQRDPQAFRPWLFGPCVVRVLVVADGFIDFDDSDFGLGEFLRALSDSPAYVRFDVTCAHRSNVSDIEIGVGRPGVVRTIKQFSFCDPGHFDVDLYDELWLVGSVTSSGACMRIAAIWYLLWDQHLIQAVTPGTHLRLGEATILNFIWVDKHARDAIGRYAAKCQTIYWVLPLLDGLVPAEVFERLRPVPDLPDPTPDPIPWLDEEPLLDLALGGDVIA